MVILLRLEAGIPPKSITDTAEKVCDKNAKLLFISCIAIRAAAVIDDIEKATGKPVVSSNQAIVWHCLKLIEYPNGVCGFGSLLRTH